MSLSALADGGQPCSNATPAHFNFVIVNFGERVTGIHTDPGTTLILKARQQFGKSSGPGQD